ncbi:MAG: undecaprenyl-diphosphatase UppP [Candidatus Bipolaricaulia bacterium]
MLQFIIILSLVQGLTEFLPISSSGHLGLIRALWGLSLPGLLFEALVHLGTLLAVLWVFRRDVWLLLRALARPSLDERAGHRHRRLLGLILVGMIPTAIFGLLLDPWLELAFSSLIVIGSGLLCTGTILFLAERKCKRGETKTRARRLEEMTLWDALAIGAAQGMAILPGVSRSGATIGLGLVLGLERGLAAEFSFLLAIPAILGAAALKGWEAWHKGASYAGLIGPYLLGAALAAISGALAIKYLLRVLRRGRLTPFACYCWLVGVGAIALALIKIR